MASYNKIIFIGFLAVLSLLLAIQSVLAVTPQEAKDGNYGLDATAQQGLGVDKAAIDSSSLPEIIGGVIGVALGFLGIVFFALIIYAGFSWMLAMGKEDKINQAKEMILAAVVGLIIVLAAYAITTLVAGIFPGITKVNP
ncbi:MAG: hypothetical protein Q8O93_02025 [bacterium]|nr:hypothetical protein [bacterium]